MNIEISSVRISPVSRRNGGLVAYASVLIGGEYILNDIRIVVGENGSLRIGMPNKIVTYRGTKRFMETFYPVTPEARQKLSQAILQAYHEVATVAS